MSNFNYSLIQTFSIPCVVQPVILVSIHFHYVPPPLLAPKSEWGVKSLLCMIGKPKNKLIRLTYNCAHLRLTKKSEIVEIEEEKKEGNI